MCYNARQSCPTRLQLLMTVAIIQAWNSSPALAHEGSCAVGDASCEKLQDLSAIDTVMGDALLQKETGRSKKLVSDAGADRANLSDAGADSSAGQDSTTDVMNFTSVEANLCCEGSVSVDERKDYAIPAESAFRPGDDLQQCAKAVQAVKQKPFKDGTVCTGEYFTHVSGAPITRCYCATNTCHFKEDMKGAILYKFDEVLPPPYKPPTAQSLATRVVGLAPASGLLLILSHLLS
mmetsp:Transcript_128601/g.274330  ORF Transcript_128601/g.274330 Transcript_128601/m.274330 type:complete len:235 (-) Transcript_128601:77-781(-)